MGIRPLTSSKAWARRSGRRPSAGPAVSGFAAPVARIAGRVLDRYATVEPDGDACVVTTRGGWTRRFLINLTLLDLPMQVLGPPELIDVARTVAARPDASRVRRARRRERRVATQ